jgi:hypothetical protein
MPLMRKPEPKRKRKVSKSFFGQKPKALFGGATKKQRQAYKSGK